MVDWDLIGTFAFAPDLEVQRVGFGAAWLTGPGTYGPPKDWRAARDALRRAVDAGVQLVDTADCYGPELSERLIAEPPASALERIANGHGASAAQIALAWLVQSSPVTCLYLERATLPGSRKTSPR